jgi:hypothetical protein
MRKPSRIIAMLSRLRKTLTVQQRVSAFEHTNKAAADAAEEERRLRAEKSERLRKLRLAGDDSDCRSLRNPMTFQTFPTKIHGDFNMDQLSTSKISSTERLRAARLAKGYSLEDLAIATGLTVAEIAAAEDSESGAARNHVVRILHALT